MTVHDAKQPYMIYEGPPPKRPVAPEPVAAETVGADEAEAERAPGSRFGVGLLVAGTLAAGIAIGVWLAPSLRPTDAIAPAEPTAPFALSVARPAEAPPPAAIETSPVAAEALPDERPRPHTVSAPSRSKPAPARVAPPQRVKTAARNTATRSPATVGGCKAGGSRALVTLCADPAIAAADNEMRGAFQRALKSGAPATALRAEQDDWLAVREDAARRSPGDLANAYQQRIEELNAIADEPPH
jgi:uncharacterized protein YecT (DUF1311 family)